MRVVPKVVPVLIPTGKNHLVSLKQFRSSHPLGVGTGKNWGTTARECRCKTQLGGMAGSEKPNAIRLRVRTDVAQLDTPGR